MNVEWVHIRVTQWLHVAIQWVALSVHVIWDTRVTDSYVQVCPTKTPFIPSISSILQNPCQTSSFRFGFVLSTLTLQLSLAVTNL